MIIDVLVTDQLNLFIVFYETYGQPERHMCPLVVTYMALGPSVQFFLIGGSFFVIWSARGMGPFLTFEAAAYTTFQKWNRWGRGGGLLGCCSVLKRGAFVRTDTTFPPSVRYTRVPRKGDGEGVLVPRISRPWIHPCKKLKIVPHPCSQGKGK